PVPGAPFSATGYPDNSSNLPGGCTRDIVHRFYQEQYQLNNGRQNLYVTGSDAVGLAMGYYNTSALPIYTYLHSDGHPHYAIADVGAPGWSNGTPGLNPTCTDPASAPNPAWPHCPNKVFQYHHQPFNYYAAYATGTPGRTHLRDEVEFMQLANNSAQTCDLNSVSFVK